MDKSSRKVVGAFLCAWLLIYATSGLAYDLRTHEQTTGRAFDVSQGVLVYLNDLGIDRNDIFDFRSRTPSNQLRGFVNNATLHDWMIEGAIREDDFQPHINCDQPQNPPSAIDRPLNHFFDVQRGGRGLTTLLVNGLPATDWALGRQGRGPSQTENQFSILDARVYQLRSLTEPKKEDRERNTALLFRTLGQVAHVLQDMAQPQHTRNDPHAGCFPQFLTGEHSVYEDYIEARARGTTFRTRGQPAPSLSFGNYPSPRFTIYQDFWTTAGQQGLADFSSRNFFSAGTNLSLFGNCGGLAEPLCDRNAYTQRATPFSFQTIDGKTVAGTVTLFLGNVQDRLTGQTIPDVAVSSRSVWDQHLESRGFFPKFSLNTLNYDSISDVLLPRAVGYSAGLLDYFFRGKLDVDLVPDPNSTDPTVVKLSGTNGSTDDALVDGTLALYADGPDGTRSPVPSLEPLNVSNIAPGQKISRRFQVDQEAERFIAVYKGTLGNEVKDPTNNFPGGVIGKVLGGLRAESIFPQGDKRMLRTVPVNGVGIFPLPAEADRLENIQWGDQDNTFVGILSNPDTPRSPDQILAFRINRPLGSGEAPLIDGLDGTQVVSADILKAVNFPFDLSLGVTVNYSQTFRVQQARLAFDVVDTNVFVQTDPKDPTVGFYELASREVTAPIVQTVLDQTIPFFQSFPIVLDRAHHCSQSCFSFGDFPFFIGPIIRPYVWKVREVTLDQQGRLLALVDVILVEPDNRTRTGDLAEEDIFGRGRWTVVAGFQVPVPGLLRGVIDVDNGKVVGVTSSPAVSLASQHTISFTSLKQHRVTTHIGGPLGGTTKETEILGRFSSENPNFATVETGTARTPTAGLLSEAILGRFRSDLEPLITVPTGIGTREFEFPLVYFVDDVTQTNKSIRVAFTSSFSTGTIIPLAQPQMIRLTTGVSPQVLLLFSQQVPGIFVFQAEGIPVRWSPEFPANTTLALSHRLPPVDSYSLLYTTSQAALLHFAASEVPDPQLGPGVFTLLVDFASQQTQTFPGLLGFQYVLLDPKFLYNLNDTKFHTLDPSLRPTALPRRLADAVPFRPPTAAYHLIKLR